MKLSTRYFILILFSIQYTDLCIIMIVFCLWHIFFTVLLWLIWCACITWLLSCFTNKMLTLVNPDSRLFQVKWHFICQTSCIYPCLFYSLHCHKMWNSYQYKSTELHFLHIKVSYIIYFNVMLWLSNLTTVEHGSTLHNWQFINVG